jgi:hypothetical protein
MRTSDYYIIAQRGSKVKNAVAGTWLWEYEEL